MAEMFTLEQARRMIAVEECASHGHDYEVITDGMGNPQTIVCGRCRKAWVVA